MEYKKHYKMPDYLGRFEMSVITSEMVRGGM